MIEFTNNDKKYCLIECVNEDNQLNIRIPFNMEQVKVIGFLSEIEYGEFVKIVHNDNMEEITSFIEEATINKSNILLIEVL